MITHISPLGSMDMLSQLEVDMLKRTASSDLYQLFRNCSLAVLNSGSLTDNSKELLSRFENFDINVLRRERGVKLEVINPPEEAFVDGRIIRSLQANLFAVLRDILFVNGQIHNAGRFQHLDLESSVHITNLVFSILRNARALHVGEARHLRILLGKALCGVDHDDTHLGALHGRQTAQHAVPLHAVLLGGVFCLNPLRSFGSVKRILQK